MRRRNAITDVPGIRVGHADDPEALTGCTVVLCERGAIGGVDQRGGAPGTRETDLLRPMHLVQKVHAVLLAGGSAFGLEAAGGVVRFLEERRVGFNVRSARVPIVPAAILFDLDVGRADIRPDAAMGYAACMRASTDPPAQGNAGAGMGATVGKLFGMGGRHEGRDRDGQPGRRRGRDRRRHRRRQRAGRRRRSGDGRDPRRSATGSDWVRCDWVEAVHSPAAWT